MKGRRKERKKTGELKRKGQGMKMRSEREKKS